MLLDFVLIEVSRIRLIYLYTCVFMEWIQDPSKHYQSLRVLHELSPNNMLRQRKTRDVNGMQLRGTTMMIPRGKDTQLDGDYEKKWHSTCKNCT